MHITLSSMPKAHSFEVDISIVGNQQKVAVYSNDTWKVTQLKLPRRESVKTEIGGAGGGGVGGW